VSVFLSVARRLYHRADGQIYLLMCGFCIIEQKGDGLAGGGDDTSLYT
jgi:hypothetical protein